MCLELAFVLLFNFVFIDFKKDGVSEYLRRRNILKLVFDELDDFYSFFFIFIVLNLFRKNNLKFDLLLLILLLLFTPFFILRSVRTLFSLSLFSLRRMNQINKTDRLGANRFQDKSNSCCFIKNMLTEKIVKDAACITFRMSDSLFDRFNPNIFGQMFIGCLMGRSYPLFELLCLFASFLESFFSLLGCKLKLFLSLLKECLYFLSGLRSTVKHPVDNLIKSNNSSFVEEVDLFGDMTFARFGMTNNDEVHNMLRVNFFRIFDLFWHLKKLVNFDLDILFFFFWTFLELFS